jgi:hypothetical protein
MREKKDWIRNRVCDLLCIRKTQVNRLWSSTIVRKNLELFEEIVENGPHMSQCIRSKIHAE